MHDSSCFPAAAGGVWAAAAAAVAAARAAVDGIASWVASDVIHPRWPRRPLNFCPPPASRRPQCRRGCPFWPSTDATAYAEKL